MAVRLAVLASMASAGCAGSAPRAGPVVPILGTPQSKPFVSFNLPNLHYIEDDALFDSVRHQRLPDEFEIRDGLDTIRLMGGRIVRIYVLSVRKGTDPPGAVRHVVGPGQFNEDAFVALDRVLAIAAELDLRVILPFVDNWPHWGGIAEYAAFRGKPREAFYTDEQLLHDFEATIDKVLLRINTINGRAYRDDPTIWAWETGNELQRPDKWAARVTKYIKERDGKHALIDGTYGPTVREASLIDPNVDIVSSHHYGQVKTNIRLIDDNVRRIQGRKRYFIGEFGLWPVADTERMLRHLLTLPIEGALIWGLRGHNRDGGFYHHMEKPPFQSFHFTGSDSGAAYDEQATMDLMRTLAFGAQNVPVPTIPAPHPPAMIEVSSHGALRFRGALGARDYAIERQLAPDGPWQVIADHYDETRVPYRPFVDVAAPMGQKVRYRVSAANETGRSEPSAPSEEAHIEGRLLVDEMDQSPSPARSDSQVEVTTEYEGRCKMDRVRLKGAPGARVVYRPEGRATTVRIYAFTLKAGQAFDLEWSADGHDFAKLPSVEESFHLPGDNPEVMWPVRITATAIPATAREVAITWLMPAQIGRVEIEAVPPPP
jgi:mannan endo-1,4-beta-mannosidase